MKRNESAMRVVAETIRAKKGLSLGIVLAVGAAVAASLCPPLLLGRVIDAMTAGEGVPAVWAIGYFALLALAGDAGCSLGPTLVNAVSGLAGGDLKAGMLAAVVFPLLLIVGLTALRRSKGGAAQ